MSYILIFLASYKKSRIVQLICLAGLIIYTLCNITGQIDWTFQIINIALLTAISMGISFTGKANKYLSVISILIYSILIDVICYYLYPDFVCGATLSQYIWQGLTFNFKGLVIAMATCVFIELTSIGAKKHEKGTVTSTR